MVTFNLLQVAQNSNMLSHTVPKAFHRISNTAPTFQIGYLEGWGNQKRWIVQQEDLKMMYESFNPEDNIKLWCELRQQKGVVENEAVKTRKKNPSPRGRRMRISRQKLVCNLKKSMETNTCIVVQLTHYGQS